MSDYQSVLKRYTTPQFRSHPVTPVAKLMGLDAYLPEIKANQQLVFPILCGLMVYRKLDSTHRQDVVARTLNLPHSSDKMASLRGKLYGMAPDIVANPYWFCWTLTDGELRAFFEENKELADFMSKLGIPSLPSFSATVTEVATSTYILSKAGLRRAASDAIKGVLHNSTVSDVGARAGMARSAATLLGGCAAVGLMLLSLLEANAQAGERDARKEMILRGAVRLEDL